MRVILVLLLFVPGVAFSNPRYAKYPPVQKPFYFDESTYNAIKKQLPAVPKLDSKVQKEDEEQLRAIQAKRTKAQCDEAKNEVPGNLKGLYEKPAGPLEKKKVEALDPFFAKIQNDGAFIVLKMKLDFPRQRPFAYIKGLEACVPLESTGSYPSGHALIAKLFALVLSDMFPAEKEKFEKRSLEVAENRVLSGVHHPSDIQAGRKIAEDIYAIIKKSPAFQDDLKKFSELK